jgi:hypothetical protein
VNASDEILDFLVEQIPAQSLANFKASDATRQRVWTLIAKEKETGLLPEEKVELDDYLRLEHLIALAKTKAMGIDSNSKKDWFDIYMACPHPFNVAPRRKQ